ncbi:CLUMA_CG013877, isoform A [Clunio marinus]|uniref:CLUMA_CG013877, isoform A n=1 Tax=Clunio marinus TaxID=568069 RepID=A0A1J1IQ36_9DIPT|nr:CLUMA_CG013877, isoform A [Clunio marinus]
MEAFNGKPILLWIKILNQSLAKAKLAENIFIYKQDKGVIKQKNLLCFETAAHIAKELLLKLLSALSFTDNVLEKCVRN